MRDARQPPPLRLLVLAVSERCDQRCAHCAIWRGVPGAGPALALADRMALVEEAIAAGVESVLLTGGEPLLSADLWPLAGRLHDAGVRVLLATNGMQLERHAEAVGRGFAEVYVSLDGGSPVTHDGLRGVASWERLQAGLAALRRHAPAVRVVARCTLHGGNLHELADVIGQARASGFHAVSFLPIDASSQAFGGDPGARQALVPRPEAVAAFERAISRMEAAGELGLGFVLEDAAKLRRIARHLRASAGAATFEPPDCDAPEWSMVVESDGRVRPCFFQPVVGPARAGLVALRASEAYADALRRIGAPNPTCQRCVCPKRGAPPTRVKTRAAAGWLERVLG